MSDKPETAPEAPAKKAPRKLLHISKTDGFKAYTTTTKHTYPFNVLVRGVSIEGQWSQHPDGVVEFLVPNDLVEAFERHTFFVSGMIVSGE